MFKNSVNKRYVPKLRFRGFENNYNKKTINDCFVILNGLSGLKAENFKYGNDKYIPYKTVFNNWFINNNELEFFEKGTKKQNEVTKNDILITSSSETLNEIGYSSIYLDNEKVYLNSFCFILRNISKEVNSQYFNWLMKNKHYRKLIVNEGQGSTRYNLQKKQFKNIVFNFPLLEEQEKISKFLNLLDKQISLLENKLKLTEQLKHNYSKNLFANKSNTPKLRFKGFEGEYSFEILNKYLEYEQPTKYLILNNENINEIGNVPVLTANKSFILGYVENELNNCYKKGECFIFDDFTTDIKYVNFLFKLRSSATKIITTKNDNYINYFFYLLKSKKPEILGHKRHWIEITSKEKRFIPPTLKEQEKISIFLSLLDKQIDNVSRKIEIIKNQKKFFLNNLFI